NVCFVPKAELTNSSLCENTGSRLIYYYAKLFSISLHAMSSARSGASRPLGGAILGSKPNHPIENWSMQ
ncbi:hypothetical protein N5I82_24695, partial [Klebsiella quasipneumoniae]|uniref:hypothetical protein n=1 Tax=Klebsiella quasipneumoniae TaxID=1463165 RepID=UPI0022481537